MRGIPGFVLLLMVTLLCGGDPQERTDRLAAPPRPVSPAATLPDPVRWIAGLSVMQVEAARIGGATLYSSSALKAEWQKAPFNVDHYEVEAIDQLTTVSRRLTSSQNLLQLGDLKSATAYAVGVRACYDKRCLVYLSSGYVIASTSAEYWQVQGSGNSYDTATHVIADGNIGSHGFVFGSWAGAAFERRLQLYYNPQGQSEKGAKIAVTSGIVSAQAGVSAVSSLQAIGGYGLRSPCLTGAPGQPAPICTGTGPVRNFLLYQAVPMTGGFIRFFFEANGTDQKNRIFHLDSRDGYGGRDFNRGTRTLCETIADYATGGECEATVVIGVQGDAVAANQGIQHARQFKIAFPTLDSTLAGRWDGAAGTPMILTVNLVDSGCSPYSFVQAYAVWDGKRWQVQYRSNGCPKLFEQMQAPNPVHLGGVRYKLYYNENPALQKQATNPQTDTKPMKVLYADGIRTGDPTTLEFEDWESPAVARDLIILWPDGSRLDLANESKFDDHVVMMPTADPKFQVIYTNMSVGGTSTLPPFIGLALLVNP